MESFALVKNSVVQNPASRNIPGLALTIGVLFQASFIVGGMHRESGLPPFIVAIPLILTATGVPLLVLFMNRYLPRFTQIDESGATIQAKSSIRNLLWSDVERIYWHPSLPILFGKGGQSVAFRPLWYSPGELKEICARIEEALGDSFDFGFRVEEWRRRTAGPVWLRVMNWGIVGALIAMMTLSYAGQINWQTMIRAIVTALAVVIPVNSFFAARSSIIWRRLNPPIRFRHCE